MYKRQILTGLGVRDGGGEGWKRLWMSSSESVSLGESPPLTVMSESSLRGRPESRICLSRGRSSIRDGQQGDGKRVD